MSAANSEEIVLQIRDQFEGLLQWVCNTGSEHPPTAYEVELTVFRRLLELGKRLLLLFLVSQAQKLHEPNLTTPAGECLPYHSQKRKSYLCIFGKMRIPINLGSGTKLMMAARLKEQVVKHSVEIRARSKCRHT